MNKLAGQILAHAFYDELEKIAGKRLTPADYKAIEAFLKTNKVTKIKKLPTPVDPVTRRGREGMRDLGSATSQGVYRSISSGTRRASSARPSFRPLRWPS